MLVLAIETSCDETSAAVVRDGAVLANVVSSQVALHSEYGGVVPELATREHLRNWLPVARRALGEAGVKVEELQGIAATRGPGLPNALLIGFKAAQSLAYALHLPFLGIHHHEGHLYSPWIWGEPLAAHFQEFQPNVALVVSGGHTLLVLVQSESQYRVLGSTLDDAAGECFDKVGKLLGLPYPAGPQIDALAEQGNPAAYEFPRPMLHDPADQFSFAGLKTSVRYFLRKNPELWRDPKALGDLCASVQAAIVDVLVSKAVRAARREGVRWITGSGGVTCNRCLRHRLGQACTEAGLELRLAERSLCTDNAAMVGVVAERKLIRSPRGDSADDEVEPSWSLEETSVL